MPKIRGRNKRFAAFALIKKLDEMNAKIERLQERFILEEINRGLYDKFMAKYQQEKLRLN